MTILNVRITKKKEGKAYPASEKPNVQNVGYAPQKSWMVLDTFWQF